MSRWQLVCHCPWSLADIRVKVCRIVLPCCSFSELRKMSVRVVFFNSLTEYKIYLVLYVVVLASEGWREARQPSVRGQLWLMAIAGARFCTGQNPFLSHDQRCQNTEGKACVENSHYSRPHGLCFMDGVIDPIKSFPSPRGNPSKFGGCTSNCLDVHRDKQTHKHVHWFYSPFNRRLLALCYGLIVVACRWLRVWWLR